MFKPVVGLDIGSRAVKMVCLRKNGDGYHVSAAAFSSIAGGGSEPPSRSAIVAAIEECFRSSEGLLSRNCHFVLGLSGAKVKVSSFNFASLTIDEVAQAVMFEAEQVCPFDVRGSVVDYQLIDMDEKQLRKNRKDIIENVKGVLAIAANEVIVEKQKLAHDASLKCVLMDSDGLATLNCLKENLASEANLPVAIVNVGRSLSTVTILGDDGLPFIRDLGHSGNDIIDHIAKAKGVSGKKIEEKLSAGERPAGFELACDRLVRDINETLSYYSIQHSSDAIRHLYVCGGFSLLDDFVTVLSDNVDSDVSVWNPFVRMACDDNAAGCELLGRCGPAFTVAAGLAMRQI